MSETKEESNSTSSDVKEEEEGSPKTEEVKTDESSKDSDKDSKESVKNDTKKEDSGKDDSEKDDSEDESDDEGMGLLDRPVEVSGCRARKKVERLEISFTPKEKSQPIQEGKGKKLGDCPRIEIQIQKTSNNELKPLHRILFNRVGGATEIKRNIRKFSGFTFGKNSSDFDKKKGQIEKLTGPILKQICSVLDLERSGVKDDVVNRVLDFLMEPKDSGKSLPKKKKSNKDKKKSGQKAKNSKAKVGKEASSDENSDVDVDIENDSASDKNSDKDEKEDNKDDKDSEDDSDPEPAKKKSKKTKTTKKAPQKKVEKKEKPKKEEKKGSAKGSKRKRDEDSGEDSVEEPAPKKKGPSDDDIRKLVKTILKDADLQEITMKKVIKQVADAYPAVDLSNKKAFIKATIKSSIS